MRISQTHQSRLETLEQRNLLDGSAVLVNDFHSDPQDGQHHAWLGNEVFFAADDGSNDVELWKSNGTTEGTTRVFDIRAGRSASLPKSFVSTGDRVFFSAYDDETGRELWSTDGTIEGTALVREISPGTDDGLSEHMQIAALNGQVVFSGVVNEDVSRLWISDGTKDGTRPLLETGASALNFVLHNDKLYFQLSSAIWETDGTTAGTRKLVDLSGYSASLIPYDSNLVFSDNSNSGWQLKSIDLQTEEVTTLHRQQGQASGSVVRAGDSILFTLSVGRSQRKHSLWRSDGIETMMLKDFSGQNVRELVAVGNEAFFSVNEGIRRKLWRSDGTVDGTRPQPGFEGDIGYTLYPASQGVYATNRYNEELGDELLYASGDDVTVLDLLPGSDGSAPAILAHQGDTTLFWTGRDRALWVTDGTTEGTKQIRSDISGASTGGDPSAMLPLGDGVAVFVNGQLWISDGTTEATQQIAEAYVNTSVASPLTYNEKLYFVSSHNTEELWMSDGTPAGTTTFLSPTNGNPIETVQNLAATDDWLYFTGDDGDGNWLWRSNGTTEGTSRIFDVDLHAPEPFGLTNVQGTLYFLSSDDEMELWKSDGTPEGTSQVALLEDQEGDMYSTNLYPAEDRVFIAFEQNDIAVWSSDGTADGTAKFWDIGYSGGLRQILGNELVFAGNDESGDYGPELWISDGTVEGTRLLKDIVPDSDGSYPNGGTVGNGTLFFHANQELWKTDGTEDGTVRVASIDGSPGYFSDTTTMLVVDETLFFAGQTPAGRYESELWMSDGTEAGTIRITDINPGLAGSSPKYLTHSNGTLYFTADDGFHGRELHRIALPIQPVPGDSNGDRVFDSADLIQVFQRGQYEDGIAMNSTFEDGDWNGDGDFDSSDLVFAFQNGFYLAAARKRQPVPTASLVFEQDEQDRRRNSDRKQQPTGESLVDAAWNLDRTWDIL